MSKNIRQKIVHAIQTTFRSSSPSPPPKQSSLKSKLSTCCSVAKPKDYEYIQYQPKQSASSTSRDDYVDLSECHSSWSSAVSTDSGISSHTDISSISRSNSNLHQLHSTKLHGDDVCSLSTLSNLSYIPHDEMNLSNFDVTGWHAIPTSFECCHCQCHHHVKTDLSQNSRPNYLYVPKVYREKRTKNEVYPVIF